MLERIENVISRYNMIPPGIRLGVAVSGGADSVFLLHFLAARGGIPLAVLHVNHGLRGEESDRDEMFVQKLAVELGMPFAKHRMDAAAGNLEQYCRRERATFFARTIAAGVVDRVATGHTASDQAETVLMRILRGTGTTGLRGVLPVTAEGLVRPLLGVRREEVRAWLTAEGIPWREDASNLSGAFLRNRVRARLIPVLREMDPHSEAALERLAEMALVDEDYWRRETDAFLETHGRWVRGGLVLDRRALRGLHPAPRLRVVRRGLELAFGGLRRLNRRHLQQVVALAEGASGEGTAEIPGGRVVRSMHWIRIGGRTESALEIPLTGEFTGNGYEMRTWIEDEGGYTEGDAATLDWERLRPPLRIHGWYAGDRFQAEGATEARLVKDFFERARVPSWDRPSWPMISDSDGIVWIYGIGAAAGAAALPETRLRLRVLCDTVSSK